MFRQRIPVLKARALPDGSFEVAGQRYRLREPIPGHLQVSNAAGATIGQLFLPENLRAERPTVRGATDTRSRHVLRAIARLLGTPRGFLPIQ
jgi:hypothetical protein